MLREIVEQREVLIPIGTFVLGFLVRGYTLSKAERLAHEREQFGLSKELADSQNEAYQKLMQALTSYSLSKGAPSLEQFFEISGPAQNYLYQQKLVADAILSGKIDEQSRDSMFVPKLIDTAEKIIPKVYSTLKGIAEKHGWPYPSGFQRGDYQSIFDVVEKYGKSNPLKMFDGEGDAASPSP